MAYEKQNWTSGDVITAEKLNHIEDGIANSGGGSSTPNTLFQNDSLYYYDVELTQKVGKSNEYDNYEEASQAYADFIDLFVTNTPKIVKVSEDVVADNPGYRYDLTGHDIEFAQGFCNEQDESVYFRVFNHDTTDELLIYYNVEGS